MSEFEKIKNKDNSGIFYHSLIENKNDDYYQSQRYVLIAPSGSGKTVLASNLLVYDIRSFNNVLIITPSADDLNWKAIAKWADEAGMNVLFTNVDEDKNLCVPKDLSKTVVIVDDLYSQHQQVPALKKFLSEMFIKGRHNKNNIIYICHSNRNIPHEIKLGCNGLFVNQPYKEIPLTEIIPKCDKKAVDEGASREGKKNQGPTESTAELRKKKTGLSTLKEEDEEDDDEKFRGCDPHQFYKLNGYEDATTIIPVKFKPISSREEIVDRLKEKIHKEDKNEKKLPGLDITKKMLLAEGELKAGNESAEKTKTETKKLNKATSKKTPEKGEGFFDIGGRRKPEEKIPRKQSVVRNNKTSHIRTGCPGIKFVDRNGLMLG